MIVRDFMYKLIYRQFGISVSSVDVSKEVGTHPVSLRIKLKHINLSADVDLLKDFGVLKINGAAMVF